MTVTKSNSTPVIKPKLINKESVMKKITITLFLCMTIGFAQNQSSQQKMTQTQEESQKRSVGSFFNSMSVRVGGPAQSYFIGFKPFGAFSPTFGVDYWGGSFSVEADYFRKEYYYGDQDTDFDDLSANGSIRLIMPRIGVKYFSDPNINLNSYVLLEGYIVIPMVNLEATTNGESFDLEDDDKERIKDGLDLMGLTLGFGTEYNFSHQFSIGGEFGLNWVLWNYNDEISDSSDDGDNYSWEESYMFKAKAGLGGGFSRMTLNFYF